MGWWLTWLVRSVRNRCLGRYLANIVISRPLWSSTSCFRLSPQRAARLIRTMTSFAQPGAELKGDHVSQLS